MPWISEEELELGGEEIWRDGCWGCKWRVVAADGSVTAAAAAEREPPIGGAESWGVASITGELGVLEAMERGGRTRARER